MDKNKGKLLEFTKIPDLPKRSFIYLLVCMGGIVFFFFAGIQPNTNALKKLDKQVQLLNNQLDKQKILFPLFTDLMKRSSEKIENQLPFPGKAKLSRDNIGKISSIFNEAAQKSNLIFISGIPDVNTLKDDSAFLLVNVSAKGEFFDCRNFLVRLGEIPYLEKIESIQITAGRRLKELNLKVWIMLD